MRYWLVMPAAGSGSRFGTALPKQYAPLLGRTVIEWALEPFLADARCQGVVVAVAAADSCWATLAPSRHPRVRTVAGGAARCDSVRSGLLSLALAADDWVLVHDAARPCLPVTDLDRLVATLSADAVGGLLAAPLVDTLKQVAEGSDTVAATVPRAGLWRALTPQMFRHGVLARALEAARADGVEPTDEAQAVERLGLPVRVVPGDAGNLKVTKADDLAQAEAVLRQREGRG